MAENYPYITNDLCLSILKHLPSKSLLKFITVSKSWCSLIKSPNFKALHLNHHTSLSQNGDNHRTFLLECDKRFYLYHYGNRSGYRCTVVPSPPNDFDIIAASYRSLICLLSSKDDSRLLLWNPSINKYREIKSPLSLYGFNLYGFNCTLGLVCNPNPVEEEDYKIVFIRYDIITLSHWGTAYLIPDYAQVYSGASLGWNQVLLPALPDRLIRMSPPCVVNDFIHWIVFRRDDNNGLQFDDFADTILIFDSKIVSFALMQLPALLKEVVDPDFSLAMLADSLAVVHYLGGKESVQVWKLEEYGLEMSWKMCYRITLSYVTGFGKFWAEKDGKVFITTSMGKLIVFNSKSDYSGVYKGRVLVNGGQAFAYTQSLLLLDEKSR